MMYSFKIHMNTSKINSKIQGTQRVALVKLVSAISRLETTLNWGDVSWGDEDVNMMLASGKEKAGPRAGRPVLERLPGKAVIFSGAAILMWLNRPAEKMHGPPKKPV